MTSTPGPTTAPIQTFRILAWSLMGALLVIAVALYVADPDQAWDQPPLWSAAAVVVVAVAVLGLVGVVGYRTPAIAPGTPEDEARKKSLTAFQSSMILRFALCESIALIALALGYVVDDGGPFLLYLLGAAIAVPAMIFHVFPSERTITAAEESLQREGGLSYLRQALGQS